MYFRCTLEKSPTNSKWGLRENLGLRRCLVKCGGDGCGPAASLRPMELDKIGLKPVSLFLHLLGCEKAFFQNLKKTFIKVKKIIQSGHNGIRLKEQPVFLFLGSAFC